MSYVIRDYGEPVRLTAGYGARHASESPNTTYEVVETFALGAGQCSPAECCSTVATR